MDWWISIYSLQRVMKAHILTNNHKGFGWYETLCKGASINTEYRSKVKDEDWKRRNIRRCKRCEKKLAEIGA